MRNKIWTQEEVRAVISTAVVALLLVGLFFYGKKLTEDNWKSFLPRKLNNSSYNYLPVA